MNLKHGDRFTLRSGRAVVVVSKPQKRQTLCCWVNGLTHSILRDLDEQGGLELWDLKAHWGENDFIRGYLGLCPADQMDEEVNEWGPVMP